MAQVIVAKKSKDWIIKLIIGIAVVYLAYRVVKGLQGFGESLQNLFKFPEIKFPEIKFPEIKFPEIMLPQVPMQTGAPSMMLATPNATPNVGTGLVNVPTEFAQQLTAQARERLDTGLVPFQQPSGDIIFVTPETRERLSQRYYMQPYSYSPSVQVNPTQYQIGETNVPRNPQELLKMGLAIDMPTKAGQPTMINKIAEALGQQRIQVGNVRVPALSLTGLSVMNPDLTASQLADLRARLTGDFPQGFNFGTNTGSGRQYQFNEGQVIGSTRNPVLQAYEAYRAMYA